MIRPDAVGNWIRLGRPSPPPHEVKAAIVLAHALGHELHVLVETGTGTGEMITSVAHAFERVYSAELNECLHADAVERYAPFDHVAITNEDGAAFLGRILPLEEPAVFWLDAHDPEGCSLLAELRVLAGRDIGRSVILADDARLMTWTRNGWPDANDVLDMARETWPGCDATVADDVLRILPMKDEA